MRRGQSPTLSRTKILDTAATITAATEVDRVTFRRLAAALDVTPMAIYRHFDDKQALLTAMLDQFIRSADVLPGRPLPWDDWLRHVCTRMYRAFLDQPSWLPFLGRLPLRAGGLEFMDRCLETLINAGFSKRQSVEAYFAMMHCLFGAALMQHGVRAYARLPIEDDTPEGAYPTIRAVWSELADIPGADHITLSLELLITGLKNRHRSA